MISRLYTAASEHMGKLPSDPNPGIVRYLSHESSQVPLGNGLQSTSGSPRVRLPYGVHEWEMGLRSHDNRRAMHTRWHPQATILSPRSFVLMVQRCWSTAVSCRRTGSNSFPKPLAPTRKFSCKRCFACPTRYRTASPQTTVPRKANDIGSSLMQWPSTPVPSIQYLPCVNPVQHSFRPILRHGDPRSALECPTLPCRISQWFRWSHSNPAPLRRAHG